MLLDQLAGRDNPPGEAIQRRRLAPTFHWLHRPGDDAPAHPAALAARVYADAHAASLAPAEDLPSSVEEAVARQLGLSEALEPSQLERIRRQFAYRNHPDRVAPALKELALERMTIANALIDQALAAARARAR